MSDADRINQLLGGGQFVTLTMHYPDFHGMKLPDDVRKEALHAAANAIMPDIIPQIPIDTGQLRRSYGFKISEMVIRAAATKRTGKGWYLKNSDLANILESGGYLRIEVTPAMMKKATRAFKAVLMKHAKKGLKTFFTRHRLVLRSKHR
jgi:hypothetical protein